MTKFFTIIIIEQSVEFYNYTTEGSVLNISEQIISNLNRGRDCSLMGVLSPYEKNVARFDSHSWTFILGIIENERQKNNDIARQCLTMFDEVRPIFDDV